MAEKAARPRLPEAWSRDAHAIYRTARHYQDVVQYLLQQLDHVSPQKQQSFGVVTAVISAFTLELLFKCIETYETGRHSRGHNLEILFSKISKQRKNEIIADWDQNWRAGIKRLAEQTGEHFPDDLRQALQHCGDTFQTLRYVHEDKFSAYYLTHLPPILLRSISRMAPEWHLQVVDIGHLDPHMKMEIAAGYLDDLPRFMAEMNGPPIARTAASAEE